MSLAKISRELAARVEALGPPPGVAYVYSPLSYARRPHELYLRAAGRGPKKAVFLGMNPGPFGMAQTGIPFGDVGMVRDYLGIEAPVDRPSREHPKRPVQGFSCPRSEVSGKRLWGLFASEFPSSSAFLAQYFVANYCPLVFMSETGSNVTPDKLDRDYLAALESACDEALRKTIRLLEPTYVVGVGAYAEKRAVRALSGLRVQVLGILHPSPASPAANRGFESAARRTLESAGVF